jgi:hypothetical protein
MAISEVCQFEVKEEVDKLKQANPGLSAAECIRRIIEFYAGVGIEVKESTAKKKYQRATKSMGTNVPTQPTPQNHSEKGGNKEISKGLTADGKPRQRAKGAGRKPKHNKPEATESNKMSTEQKRHWRTATHRLKRLAEYMLENCHTPDGLPENIGKEFIRYFDTLEVFNDELRSNLSRICW